MRNILVAVQYILSGEMCTCIVDENEWIFIHNLRGRLNALHELFEILFCESDVND